MLGSLTRLTLAALGSAKQAAVAAMEIKHASSVKFTLPRLANLLCCEKLASKLRRWTSANKIYSLSFQNAKHMRRTEGGNTVPEV